ncbi:MAG TPA: radical SAM protein [Micromonosporaceae bacterium]|nr:radical SAM protein [Micromonosporaceae bacterium]
MKVMFVNPHYPHDPYTLLLHPPLGYAYMARQLKAVGHEVIHVDLPFLGNDPNQLSAALDEYRPDLVGITSVDYVLLYDAEHSVVELCAALDAGGTDDVLRKVPGLCYRDGDGRPSTTTPSPPLMELDELGRPDRSIFDLAPYLDYDYETVVMTARGCPSRCTFCSTTVSGRRARWNGPAHICDELEEVSGYGFRSVFFGDDTFSGDPRRTIAICNEMQARGLSIPWTSNMRAQDARPAVLEAMRAAGAYRVFMGFESIQKATLRLVKKGATPERMIEKAELVRQFGLELHASFIIGAPGDTDETLAATMDYIRLLNPTVATFNVMEPRPGTDVYHNPQRYGMTIPDPYWYESSSWLDMPVCANEQLDQEKIRNWVDRCYLEFCSGDFRSPEQLGKLNEVEDQWRSSGLTAPVAS